MPRRNIQNKWLTKRLNIEREHLLVFDQVAELETVRSRRANEGLAARSTSEDGAGVMFSHVRCSRVYEDWFLSSEE